VGCRKVLLGSSYMSDEPKELLPLGTEQGGNTNSFWGRCTRLLRQIRDAIAGLFSFKTNPWRSLVVLGVCLVALFIAVWIFDKIFVYFLARSYVQQVADVFDLNKHLAQAIVYLTFVAIVFVGGLTLSLSKQKRLIGIAAIVALLTGHSLILW